MRTLQYARENGCSWDASTCIGAAEGDAFRSRSKPFLAHVPSVKSSLIPFIHSLVIFLTGRGNRLNDTAAPFASVSRAAWLFLGGSVPGSWYCAC